MFSKLDKLTSESGEGPSKVAKLGIYNCYQIDEVVTTSFSWFRTLEVLILDNNKLTDKFLLTLLHWFPNLTELDLTANDFTILPEIINHCVFLRRLVLDRCYQLSEIRGIPSGVKHLSAKGCTSLISQSLSLLSSEKLHEGGGTDFIFPGSRIPTWFHHCCKGLSLSFWFRKRFPLVALCLGYGAYSWAAPGFYSWTASEADSRTVSEAYSRGDAGLFIIQMHVNSHKIKSKFLLNSGDRSAEHVYLFDLQNAFPSLQPDGEAMQEYIKDGWNHVEFQFQGFVSMPVWTGVYVYKHNHDTADVRFIDPII
ncbi:hypothetical protein L6164_001405 [Bauhinia variegata]|uniref:Uncharacterized protein n=1 Tax=Bauhinia variegata TaxID=167791 RepID=A0ACB9Q9D9_BAUVA|nr:hypothetical protein L6164_001405 [Bauhinia variegata]